MSDQINSSTSGEEAVHISLCQRLTSDEAVKLHEVLLGTGMDEVVIEASSVEFLGAASLQVMMSAVKTAQRDQKTLRIENPSQDFLAGLNRLGAEPSDLSIEEAVSCL
jgi:anti-anti-sigma regulatory factor